MTRYARAGKGTHNRVEKDPTPWGELVPPKPERVRGAPDEGGARKFPNKNRKKERFQKGKRNFSGKESTDKTPNSSFSKNNAESDKSSSASADTGTERTGPHKGSKRPQNPNIRGFGESKSVKILGQFWVPLEDGKRLKNLTKKLKSQGLPRKEILEALKNERRKAEKASKRQRDKTCFQCRQFGHILSDCPNLRKASVGDNLNIDEEPNGDSEQGLVCFKCGSTEHTSRNCRRKGENFEFAKCFICSGSGHIARQCPKNFNGIYPSGGGCGECGSITHLKKDCPDIIGIESNPSDRNDDGAVTLRMSDPFSSTEYEPAVYDQGGEDMKDASEVDEGDHNESANFSGPKVSTKKQTPGKKKEKRKSNTEDTPSMFDFTFERDERPAPALVTKPLFANANKKRKIVKF